MAFVDVSMSPLSRGGLGETKRELLEGLRETKAESRGKGHVVMTPEKTFPQTENEAKQKDENVQRVPGE